MLSPTARTALDAYGGEEIWRRAVRVEASVSVRGWVLRLKGRTPFRHAQVGVRVAEPAGSIEPIDREGNRGVVEGHRVWIESRAGGVIESRHGARELLLSRRRRFFWDRIDQACFSIVAFWNYLTMPSLLLRDDIEWREVGESVLEATFPDGFATHCSTQRFRFNPRNGLLVQHDYTAEMIGRWACAAHTVIEHRSWQGIPYPSRRVVTPRRRNGRPRRWPVLVEIDVHDWRIVENV
jgi:hypothetical protein